MQDENLKIKALHHFNLMEGYSCDDVIDICQRALNYKLQINQNLFHQKFDSFLVEQARGLIELQNRKHKKNEPEVYVIECASINSAAQNALLKILEDNRSDNYYFLLVPQTNLLLPTILSRGMVFHKDASLDRDTLANLVSIHEDFCSLEEIRNKSVLEKTKYLDRLLLDYKKGRITKSDIKKQIKLWILEIEEQIRNKNVKNALQIKQLNQLILYIDQNGSSVKSILEFLVLTI